MNQNKLVSVLSKIAILLLVFFVGQYVGTRFAATDPSPLGEPRSESSSEVSVMFDYGDGAPQAIQDVPVEEGDSVFDAVEAAASRGGIEIEYEDYGGDLGVFLQSVNGVGADGGDAWWQYWVNNEYGTIGMSSREVNPGDVVFLKFTGSNPTE